MDNITSYEVSGLTHLDSPLSKKEKIILHQIILNLKGLTSKTKNEKIFISV